MLVHKPLLGQIQNAIKIKNKSINNKIARFCYESKYLPPFLFAIVFEKNNTPKNNTKCANTDD